MAQVAALWRHPIKSHGREALEAVMLVAGQTIPWDRHWAVTHTATKFDAANPDWVVCRNFVIGTYAPELAGLWARLDEGTGVMHLRHADLGEITFAPDDPTEAARFLDWAAPLTANLVARPAAVVTAGVRGMTDSAYPSVSIMNTASNTAVENQLGRPLEPERWRGNIWIDGLAPWAEWDWIGHEVRIGGAVLRVVERIKRCKHTMANPVTGRRDADTLAALTEGWGHQHFGVYAEVTTGGRVAIGDACEVL